jgi:putative ABC transport system ATP-binding protein
MSTDADGAQRGAAESVASASPPANVARLEDVTYAYSGSAPVLRIPHLSIAPGEAVFLRGPSGSGKSTLLSLLAGILQPQAGVVELLGHRLSETAGHRRDALRAAHLGVIFQLFNLVPYLSVLANITLPCRFSRRRRERALAGAGSLAAEAGRLAGRLGLGDALLDKPATALSVGQQQRVAAARALIGAPELILADEPTSALDADSRERFIELLREECTRSGASLLFVSHDLTLAAAFDRTIDLPALNRIER